MLILLHERIEEMNQFNSSSLNHLLTLNTALEAWRRMKKGWLFKELNMVLWGFGGALRKKKAAGF